MGKKLWLLFGHGCLHANMPLGKALLGRRRGGTRQSMWSSTNLVSPMGNAGRMPKVLLAQAWWRLLINFGLNKQMQKLFFMLQVLKSELWTYRSWLTG